MGDYVCNQSLGLFEMWSFAHGSTDTCCCDSQGEKGSMSDQLPPDVAEPFNQLRRMNGLQAHLKPVPG